MVYFILCVIGHIIGINYWTSLTQINCAGTWSFCKNETILENSIRWSVGQPDNWMGNQNFAVLYYKLGAAELEIDDKADVTPFPFLCEVCINISFLKNLSLN
jgi:hypothetical protein